MQLENSSFNFEYKKYSFEVEYSKEDKDKVSGKKISDYYLSKYQFEVFTFSFGESKKQVETLSLADLGYEGKPIGDLSQDEAKELVGEDGFFGVTKTSERLSTFVLEGAGDDLDMLKAGREGILQGFKEAEDLWGGKLPDISYNTLEKALKVIDDKISSLGGKVLDTTV